MILHLLYKALRGWETMVYLLVVMLLCLHTLHCHTCSDNSCPWSLLSFMICSFTWMRGRPENNMGSVWLFQGPQMTKKMFLVVMLISPPCLCLGVWYFKINMFKYCLYIKCTFMYFWKGHSYQVVKKYSIKLQ